MQIETTRCLGKFSVVLCLHIPRLLAEGGTDRFKRSRQRRSPALYIYLWATLWVFKDISTRTRVTERADPYVRGIGGILCNSNSRSATKRAYLNVQNWEDHQLPVWCFKNRRPGFALISSLAWSQKIFSSWVARTQFKYLGSEAPIKTKIPTQQEGCLISQKMTERRPKLSLWWIQFFVSLAKLFRFEMWV